MIIRLKRAYTAAEPSDGFRVLVDRLWPRGVAKDKLQVDLWLKEIAPSDALRKQFGHNADRWQEFKEGYVSELDRHREALALVLAALTRGPVTLVYGARDERHNNAVVLRCYLEGLLHVERREAAAQ